jgi:V/A-type H+-transporting ATPase subunit F
MLVIGNEDAVLGLSLVGVPGRVAKTITEVVEALDEALADPELGIILVTHDLAKLIPARMDQLKMRSTVPLVVEIPSPGGPDPDEPSLEQVVQRAVGVKF